MDTSEFSNYTGNMINNKIIKLDCNENPLGPSKLAIEAIQHHLGSISRYPDNLTQSLKIKLSNRLAVNTNNLVIGNGSSSILKLIIDLFLENSSEIIIPNLTYDFVYNYARSRLSHTISVPLNGWYIDLCLMLKYLTHKTRLIYLANPNNPTGTCFSHDELEYFLSRIPSNTLVILDEAYHEYAQQKDFPQSIALQKYFPNLIIVRTFSKIHGLAGLRIGYSISNENIAKKINNAIIKHSINNIALIAADAAIEDVSHLKKSLETNLREKMRLTNLFRKLDLPFVPSDTNFIFFNTKHFAKDIQHYLKSQRVMVKTIENSAYHNYLRVSIGVDKENEAFAYAMEQLTTKNYLLLSAMDNC